MLLLRDRGADLDAAGVRPFGISRDSPWSHVAWASHLAVDVGAAPLGLERRGDPRLRRGVRGARDGGRADAERVPDRGRYGQGLVAAAEGDAGPRRGDRGRFLALALALYVACGALGDLARGPPLDGGRYLARPAPGYGEAAAGDHLQLGWAFWLPGHQLERGAAPWADPYSFRPEARGVAEPAGLAARRSPSGRSACSSGTSGPTTCVVLLSFVAAGGLACWWLRALGLARGAALAGGLVFALAPYRVGPVDGAPARADRVPPPRDAARPRAAALRAGRRSRWRRSRSRDRSTSRWARSLLALGYAWARVPRRGLVAGRARPRSCAAVRGDRRPAGRRRGLDRGRRALVRTGAALLGGALGLRHARRRGRDRGARLRGLADAAPGGRRACGRSGAGAGSPCCLGARGASSPACSPSARTCPCTSRSGTPSRRSASRACPSGCCRSACLAVAALVAFALDAAARRASGSEPPAWYSARPRRPPCSCCSRSTCGSRCSAPSTADAATPPTRRSQRRRAPARAAGLPARHPLRLRLPRLRTTVAARAAAGLLDDRAAGRRPARPASYAGCRAAAGRFRAELGVRFVVVHRGLYRQSGFFAPGCAERAETALRRHGWRLLARDGRDLQLAGSMTWSEPCAANESPRWHDAPAVRHARVPARVHGRPALRSTAGSRAGGTQALLGLLTFGVLAVCLRAPRGTPAAGRRSSASRSRRCSRSSAR